MLSGLKQHEPIAKIFLFVAIKFTLTVGHLKEPANRSSRGVKCERRQQQKIPSTMKLRQFTSTV